MRLTYRGVTYDQSAAMPVYDAAIGGTYRGQLWRRHQLAAKLPLQPMQALKYRGVPYTIGELARVGKVAPAAKVPASVTRALAEPVLRSLKSETYRLHRANLQHNIVHRLEVAKAQNNAPLITILEREFAELAV